MFEIASKEYLLKIYKSKTLFSNNGHKYKQETQRFLKKHRYLLPDTFGCVFYFITRLSYYYVAVDLSSYFNFYFSIVIIHLLCLFLIIYFLF